MVVHCLCGAAALEQEAGKVAAWKAAAEEAVAWVGAARKVEAPGWGALVVKAMERELGWRRSWRELEVAGRQCC